MLMLVWGSSIGPSIPKNNRFRWTKFLIDDWVVLRVTKVAVTTIAEMPKYYR